MPKPKRLFIDALSIVPRHMSGVGHNALELIKTLDNLAEADHSVQIYLVVPLWKKRSLSRYNFSGRLKVKVFPLPARFIELLLRLDIMPPVDLILGKGSYIFPNYRNWPLRRSRSYTYILDTVFMRYPQFVQPRNLTYLKKYIPIWIARADRIITISEFSKNELTRYFNIPGSKITVLPCGVNRDTFYPRSKKEIERIKSRYDIGRQDYLLYLGNIEPRKNLARLVQAFNSLPDSIKTTHTLVMAGGDGWLNEDIYKEINKARQDGSTIVLPKEYIADEDLPALLSGASILVHPALYEGFGISPLQAMACGVPVITANSSSLPEVVGKAAILVDPTDTEKITLAIQEVLQDKKLRENLSKSGLQQALKFSWEKSAAKLIDTITRGNNL